MAEPIAPRDTSPTAPIPPAAEPQQTIVIETVPIGAPKQRRWVWWVVALGVVGILLIVAGFVADSWARSYALATVRERVITLLDLPPGAQVDVELSGGSMLWQAMVGSVNEVRVGVDEFAIGELTGSADLVARAVPLDSSHPVGSIDIDVRIAESELSKLAANFSGLALDEIAVRDGIIHVSTEWQLLFLTIPLAVDLAPVAIDTGISFDPHVIYVGNERLTVADLRAHPQLSSIAGTLLAAQDLCIADRIPEALRVTDAAIQGSELVVSLGAERVAFDDPSFTRNGSC